MKRTILFSLLTLFGLRLVAASQCDDFEWRNATVYFVITDRFANGDTDNDVNYGRINDYGSERLNAATFHGGDFKGMTQKAREGYFTDLGIDVVWMTDVYEQIHGWMSGSGAVNDLSEKKNRIFTIESTTPEGIVAIDLICDNAFFSVNNRESYHIFGNTLFWYHKKHYFCRLIAKAPLKRLLR